MKLRFVTLWLLICLFSILFTAGAATITNSPKQNIYGAGRSTLPQPSGGGGGISPIRIDLPSALSRFLLFTSITGSVNFGNGNPAKDFDNDGQNQSGWSTDAYPWNGISGIYASNRIGFLSGCFLTPNPPTNAAPSRLSFTNVDFVSLAPEIAQVFFIGDGKNADGQTQIFRIPDQATRLYLGFVDSLDILTGGNPGYYDDNIGQIVATFQILSQSPYISAIQDSAQVCSITVTNLIPGLSNKLFSTFSLASSNWTPVLGFIAPTTSVFVCTDSNATASAKYYRVATIIP